MLLSITVHFVYGLCFVTLTFDLSTVQVWRQDVHLFMRISSSWVVRHCSLTSWLQNDCNRVTFTAVSMHAKYELSTAFQVRQTDRQAYQSIISIQGHREFHFGNSREFSYVLNYRREFAGIFEIPAGNPGNLFKYCFFEKILLLIMTFLIFTARPHCSQCRPL